tara:strand:+ start:1326 stop:1643 length:318 start_codon:yes stop_codon:yes gene_type:complete
MTNANKKVIPKNSFTIAGVSHYKNVCKLIKENDILSMMPDPDNKFDENAIKICNSKNEQCGFVPKSINKYLKDIEKKRVLKVIETGLYEGNYWIRVKTHKIKKSQ